MGSGKRLVRSGCTGGDPEDKMIINQIMLRFRPIAPRPVTAESTVNLVPLQKRTKRKYVRVKKKKIMNDQTVAMLEVSNGGEFVTDPVRKLPDWISFDVSGNNSDDIITRLIAPARSTVDLHDGDLAVSLNRRQLVESWITVESVIGTCEEDGQEIWKDLERDSCPCFVSKGYDEVQWVNLAYRRMVDPNPEGGAPPKEVVVWLGVKVERSGFEYWPAFSCRVRVVYLLSEKKKKQMTMTVPCDVWRMDSGNYAWRLDVKAALSLGRLN